MAALWGMPPVAALGDVPPVDALGDAPPAEHAVRITTSPPSAMTFLNVRIGFSFVSHDPVLGPGVLPPDFSATCWRDGPLFRDDVDCFLHPLSSIVPASRPGGAGRAGSQSPLWAAAVTRASTRRGSTSFQVSPSLLSEVPTMHPSTTRSIFATVSGLTPVLAMTAVLSPTASFAARSSLTRTPVPVTTPDTHTASASELKTADRAVSPISRAATGAANSALTLKNSFTLPAPSWCRYDSALPGRCSRSRSLRRTPR